MTIGVAVVVAVAVDVAVMVAVAVGVSVVVGEGVEVRVGATAAVAVVVSVGVAASSDRIMSGKYSKGSSEIGVGAGTWLPLARLRPAPALSRHITVRAMIALALISISRHE